MSQVLVKKVIGSILIIGAFFITIAVISPQMFSQGCSQVRALTEEEEQLVAVDNSFGLKLFAELCDGEDGNVFISPLSVSMALGMALNGADGETKQAILDTLELSGLSDEEINQSYQGLIQILKSLDKKVIFELANSVWYDDSYVTKQDFIDTNQTYFDAEVAELDFDDPIAPSIVNNWVNQKTNGKIDKIIDDFPFLTAASLLNAVYFEGAWKSKFKEEDTRDGTFYMADGTEKACKMMFQKGDFQYSDNEHFEVIDLPYGNGKYSMTILLPYQESSNPSWHPDDWTVDDIVDNMTQENWEQWTDELSETEKSLYLPRFSLEYDLKMKEVLTTLGMGIAFDDANADFSKMSDAGVWIDDITHKTFLEVDEEGTRAGAVTLTVWLSRDLPMVVNHPFVLVIREQYTNSILFIGKIMDPDFGM